MSFFLHKRHCEPAKQAWQSLKSFFVTSTIRLPQSLCSFAMTAYVALTRLLRLLTQTRNDKHCSLSIIKLIICVLVTTISACGIKGNPISPSEAKLAPKNQSLFPLESQEKSNIADKTTKNTYVDTGTLFQAGGSYSTGFGLKNDNLDDVFERIKPKSAIRKNISIVKLDI
jgi:predicted small lipoprotein YifL